jgi:hypothetical protein
MNARREILRPSSFAKGSIMKRTVLAVALLAAALDAGATNMVTVSEPNSAASYEVDTDSFRQSGHSVTMRLSTFKAGLGSVGAKMIILKRNCWGREGLLWVYWDDGEVSPLRWSADGVHVPDEIGRVMCSTARAAGVL